MLSHDLARALLARRNNDIRVEVLVDDDPVGERDIYATRVPLRDDLAESRWRINPDDLISYDDDKDVIVVRAGHVVLGGEPRD